jgi:hypothetical protein
VFVVVVIFAIVTSVFGLLFGLFGLALVFSGDVVGVVIGLVIVLLAIGVPAALVFVAWRVRPGRRPPEHFAVSASAQELRRGDEVTVHLDVTAPDRIGERLEYGLVCTAWYDDQQRQTSSGAGGSGMGHAQTRRVAVETTAWESWVEAGRAAGVQSTTFRLPPDGPFSYEGRCLTFAWRASAREPKDLAIDPRRDVPIWVAP